MLVSSAAAATAAALVWRQPVDGRRSLVPAHSLSVVTGMAVAVLLPQVWDAASESGDITGLNHTATLTYSLPWGIGIAATGWVRGRYASAARTTVTVAALLCAVLVIAGHTLFNFSTPQIGE